MSAKDVQTRQLADQVTLTIAKTELKNAEDLAHTVYTYSVSPPNFIYPPLG
jgi:hypothetical protein